MYITVKSVKRKIGFKGIELNDLLIGLPALFVLLFLFSFVELRKIAIILLVITIFLFLPVNLSKKNRMYKIIYLFFKFLINKKEYVYQKLTDRKEEFVDEDSRRSKNETDS
mgnify:CR=1 FL=1